MWRILILSGVLSAIPRPVLADARCLEYGIVNLPGTLVHQTYPGPPDYESVTKGDAPQVIWVLLLDSGICVVDSRSSFPRHYNEREIQLVLDADQHARYRNLLGKKILVTGQLFPGGARYDKRLALKASEVQRLTTAPVR